MLGRNGALALQAPLKDCLDGRKPLDPDDEIKKAL